MVDILALAVSHGLLALAAWRLLFRPDLDVETGSEKPASGVGASPRASRVARPIRREMRWPSGKVQEQGEGGAEDA
ncbi:hypothetical protein [Novosphingobium sp. ZW T3_23]|uniref:hypothetical protein n=1 Tax=Novosphingobium sp. ZW T3_23 TaxID=3378084 RepID=UPI003854E677